MLTMSSRPGRRGKKTQRTRRLVFDRRRMQKMVDTVMESQRFYEDYARQRDKDAEEHREKDPPPIFNKRLFVSTGNVVITNEARRIMSRNGRVRPNCEPEPLTKSELMVMRSVVEGLKLVHKGHDYVKDALSHVITFESYGAFQYIVKRPYEECLSCYYIVQGGVEVTYDMKMAETRSVYQPNIIYNHGTGEFLGLVSLEGLSEDMSPPATVYTKERCEFLRIDRQKFHSIVEKYSELYDEEKRAFMSRGHCVLSRMPEESKEKILDKIYRQDLAPNRQVIAQGDSSDFIFFVYSGRCQLYKEVYVPETGQKSNFLLTSCEEGSFFGEECILDKTGSYCTATTASHTTIFKVHKSAFEIVSKDHLHNLIEQHRNEYPDEHDLRERGYTIHTWNDFKHKAVRQCLEERGHLKYMNTRDPRIVRTRPPTACERNKENMYRFMVKGGRYEPMRVREISAHTTSGSSSRGPSRPRTAIGLRHSTPLSNRSADTRDKDPTDDDPETVDSLRLSGSITQMPSDMARVLAKHVGKQMSKDQIQQILREGDCRELLKLLDESSEVGRQLRMAMEAPSGKEGFTKTTVLMTMKTDDIVRKAKEMAESKGDNRSNDIDDDGQEWNTVLHEENKHAKAQIAADRFRVAHLSRKMKALTKRRETLRQKLAPKQTTEPPPPPPPPPKTFILDKIQQDYQGLHPEEAKKKTQTIGLTALFLARNLSRRHRQSSDTSLLQESGERRNEAVETLATHDNKRPISAPTSMMNLTRHTAVRDLKIKTKPDTKGRQSGLTRDQLKPPMVVRKIKTEQTKIAPRPALPRPRQFLS
ncbi:uncharacterized protein LOC124139092 isoform X2 [Haliotis rufescens]|uniref:uncharacterized protein LOC124139092 isoform X2 n=1 Tax=Haliotis rufescens TaxID=6454 RepID=UPI00201F5F84|nr:uncharacterized protein LOC124139092 isoform X2 [Haliotis rufescens]